MKHQEFMETRSAIAPNVDNLARKTQNRKCPEKEPWVFLVVLPLKLFFWIFLTELPDISKNINDSIQKTKMRYNSINQFSGPAYPWGVAGAAAQVGASKHLDPLQQRIDALLGCQGETN